MNIDISIKYKIKYFKLIMTEKRLAFLKLFVSLFKNLEKILIQQETLDEVNKIIKNLSQYIDPEVWLNFYHSVCNFYI